MFQVNAPFPWHCCLLRAPPAAVPFVKRLKIHFVRGLILSAWIRLDRACLNHTDCAFPKSPAGPTFLIHEKAREGESQELLSQAVPLLYISSASCIRKPGIKQGGFQGVNPPPVFGTAKEKRERIKIWDTTGVPKPKSYLDTIFSLQSEVFESVAPCYLPASLLPSSADR